LRGPVELYALDEQISYRAELVEVDFSRYARLIALEPDLFHDSLLV
jgi:hypothetical protein